MLKFYQLIFVFLLNFWYNHSEVSEKILEGKQETNNE